MGLPERPFHCDWYDFFAIRWQGIGDVLQTDERTLVHQVLAKGSGEAAGRRLIVTVVFVFIGQALSSTVMRAAYRPYSVGSSPESMDDGERPSDATTTRQGK